MIRELLERVDSLAIAIRRGRAVNVNDRQTKTDVIAFATAYFQETRPTVVAASGESPELRALDEAFQALIRLGHGSNARRTYQDLLKSIRRALAALNVAVLSAVSEKGTGGLKGSTFSKEEELIVSTLENYVPSSAASYRQGILDLRSQERLSYRGTAAEFREVLRETLDHLAPDADVQKQPGFKFEPDQTRPTMKQKVRFVLASRGRNKTQRESTEKSLSLVDELSGEITRAVYNRASLATHVQTSRAEVLKVKRYVDTILVDLLEIPT